MGLNQRVYFDAGIKPVYAGARLLQELEFVGQCIGSGVDNFESKLNWFADSHERSIFIGLQVFGRIK
jgi:hypothetical protein